MGLGGRSLVLQRRLAIADRIRRDGATRVETLAALLGVSAVTVRADLAYLEEQGLVVRSLGKARPVPAADTGGGAAAMRRAAFLPMLRAAAELVGHRLTLLLGPGSLPVQLLPELSDRQGLVLLLTALDAVPMARHCIGDRLHLLGSSLGGPASLHGLGSHRVDLFVFQASRIASGFAILPPGASEPLHQAACRQAADSAALVSGEAAEAGQPRVPLSAIGQLLLPGMPDPALRAMLADCGFTSGGVQPDGALLFSNARRGRALRSA